MKKMVFLIGSLGCISLVAMKWPAEEQEIPAAAKAQRNEPERMQQELVGFPAEQPRELSQATKEHIEHLRSLAVRGEFPPEIGTKILKSLAQVKVAGTTEEQKLYNAIANIQAFMKAFPQFYGDVQINRDLIRELANRYARGNVIKVVVALATTGAGQWLKEYVGNDQVRKKTLAIELVRAAGHGQLGTVRFIVQYVPEIINSTIGNDTALIAAAENGHTAVVERLLQVPGIQVNAPGSQGALALIAAAQNGHTAIVEQLLQLPIYVDYQNKNGLTALMCAVANGHVAVVERLLQVPGINVNAQDQQGATALQAAASKGDLAIVNRLLQVPGINVNAQAQRGRTALILAALKGHTAIVERLLRVPGITEFPVQILFNNQQMQGNQGYIALLIAIIKGHVATVERLLQVPDIIMQQGYQGAAALVLAIRNGHVAVVERLLQVPGINVNARLQNGTTVLTAVQRMDSPNKEAIIKLLRDHGATE